MKPRCACSWRISKAAALQSRADLKTGAGKLKLELKHTRFEFKLLAWRTQSEPIEEHVVKQERPNIDFIVGDNGGQVEGAVVTLLDEMNEFVARAEHSQAIDDACNDCERELREPARTGRDVARGSAAA